MDGLSTIQILKEMGGGLSAVVILALAGAVIALYRKNEKLLDKLLDCSEANAEKTRELHEKTLTAVNANTEATKAANATTQTAIGMIERGRNRE